MENYSKELLTDSARQKYIEHFIKKIRSNANSNINKLEWCKRKLPLAYRFIKEMGAIRMKSNHCGQVVPLEGALNIVEMVQSITRIPCICRSVTTGKNNARYCLLLGIDPSNSIKDWPELESSLETLTPDEAKQLLNEFESL